MDHLLCTRLRILRADTPAAAEGLKRRSGAVDPVSQRRVSNVTALLVLTCLCLVKREINVTDTQFFETNRISIKVLRNSVFDLIDSERSDEYEQGWI